MRRNRKRSGKLSIQRLAWWVMLATIAYAAYQTPVEAWAKLGGMILRAVKQETAATIGD